MKVISTRVHGMLDYAMGLLLVVAPWLLGFAEGGAETWIPVILGAGTIVYSLMTIYEFGAVKLIPMSGHLWIDAVSGIVLAASPWLFDFHESVYLSHLILGLVEIGVVLMTNPVPSTDF